MRSARLWFIAALVLAGAVLTAMPPAARPASAAPDEAPAQITVVVPADAEVFFDGEATQQKGAERLFSTPPLTVGKTFHYDVLARWKEGDKPVDHHRRVDVSGGGTIRVDFTTAAPVVDDKGKLTEEEALQIATDAYIYGYPLVTMEMTRRVMTNAETPKDNHAPMGQFFNAETYPDASFKDVTAPNADTLYSTAWLDLSKEPYVLSIPDEGDRYYLMPMLDAYTNVFQVPGKRTTGDKAQKYAITGPGWKGTLPEGVTEYKSPTSLVWILGRTYCTGTPEDYKAVHEIQAKYKLVPLSVYGKDYTPPKGKVDPAVDMKTAVREQVNKMDTASYFKLMAALMKDNPPAKADAPIIEKMAKIGIVPGQDFDAGKLDPTVAKSLAGVPKAAGEKIMAQEAKAGETVNGWSVMTKGMGEYGMNYVQRAFVTVVGLGANRPQDAIYPMAKVDGAGKPLNGANKYTMHFAKGETPPAQGFWSLTMYDENYFFVDNPLNKYTISPRNELKANEDGSIDLTIQNESPGKDKESNWLPAPKGGFILMMRLYWPNEKDPSILNGSWKPPVVKPAG